jgi:hypothetical protein
MRSTVVSSVCASERCEIAYDLEECPRALELELDVARAFSSAKRVGRAGGERGEGRELGLLRHPVLGVEELQCRERRLAERQRDGERRAVGERRVVLDRRGPPGLERRAHELDGPFGFGVERPERGDELGLTAAADAPEGACARPRGLHRDSHRLLGGSAHVTACGQRLSCQLEPLHAAARSSGAAVGGERPHRQGELRRDEVGDGAVILAERRRDPHELDRADDASACTRRHREHAGSLHALAGAPNRLGHLARGDRPTRRTGARDLGSERRPFRRQGARRQVTLRVDHAEHGQIRLGCARRDAGDCGQRSAQICRRSDLRCRVGEQFDGQPPGFDHHRKEE